jgi:hypothetical protein
MDHAHPRHGFAEWFLLACGVWLIGLGLYFIFVRPPLLPEDVRYMELAGPLLAGVEPGLLKWLPKVFTVMGGFMAGAGVLTGYLALQVLPLHLRGSALVLGVVGALTVGLMSLVNFVLHSDFRFVLAIPPILWMAALLMYLRPFRSMDRT